MRRDGAVLAVAARILESRVEAARRVGARELADELLSSIQAELDYGQEADAGARLRANRAGDAGVAIPAVRRTLSTARVLVMDEISGRPLSDVAAVDAVPVERAVLARRLLASFLGQILQDGYYHADPHPGNVLLDTEGTLWLLDFGAVGRLDPLSLEALQGMAIGFAVSDGSVIARAVRHLVGDDRSDMRLLERDLSLLLGEAQAGAGMSPAVLSGVLGVMERHGLRRPRALLLLSRTLLTLEGTLRLIDPEFDLAAEASRLVGQDGLVSAGTPTEILRRELVRALPALRSLPEHAETLGGQLRAGRLVLRSERYAGGDRRVVEAWIDRVLVAVAGGIGALRADGRRDGAGQQHPRHALGPRLLRPDRGHRAATAHRGAEPPRTVPARRLTQRSYSASSATVYRLAAGGLRRERVRLARPSAGSGREEERSSGAGGFRTPAGAQRLR